MEKLISVDKLIKKAEQRKINFGKGNPYNRLRYYTKIGWLPHMTRKRDADGEVKGHYPETALETLIYIETLKSEGLSNEQIEKKLSAKKTLTNFRTTIASKEFRNRVTLAVAALLLLIVIATELGIIKIGSNKNLVYKVESGTQVNKVLSSGTAFVSKGQRKVFIETQEVNISSKVMVTFSQDYFPATRYWVSSIQSGEGFTLELDTTPQNNAGFTWWVTE